MAAEPSLEDATAASSPALEASQVAPATLPTEETSTILEKGKLRISESETSEMKDAETDDGGIGERRKVDTDLADTDLIHPIPRIGQSSSKPIRLKV
jgi:hypothetical protein